MKKHFNEIACSAAVAVFVCFIVPLQSLLSSPNGFDFSVANFLAESVVVTGVFAAVSSAVVIWISRRFGGVPLAVLVALLVCIYLETGLFSIGLPALDGMWTFSNRRRALINGAEWAAVFAVGLLFRRFVARYAGWISAALLLLGLASIFDSAPASGRFDFEACPLKDGLASCYKVVESARFSTNRNVVVIILDSTPASVTTELLEESPELRARFPGFVAYRKNLAMGPATAFGLPGLMTGIYLGDKGPMSLADYGMSIFGEDSVLYPYVCENKAVYYSGAYHRFGYTNRLDEKYTHENVECGLREVYFRPGCETPFMRLADVIAIRVSPYLLKPFIQRYSSKIAARSKSHVQLAWDDEYIVKNLTASPPSEDSLSFCVFHTHGLHWPIQFDRFGRPLPEPLTIPEYARAGQKLIGREVYVSAMKEASYYVLSNVADLFDEFKRRGIYDCSTIVVMADHGCASLRDEKNHGSESSILWVKPENAEKDFVICEAPTTNARIKSLLLTLKDRSLGYAEVTAELTVGKRIFRANYKNYSTGPNYKEYVYGEDGGLVSVFER